MSLPLTTTSPTVDAQRHGVPSGPFIYIACPWSPMGGGMFKVAEYLIDSQRLSDKGVHLRPLDTRGGGAAIASGLVTMRALWALVRGRQSGRLAGVHVNMAERLSLVRKGLVVIFSRLLGVPVVLHLHAAQLHHQYHHLSRVLRWLLRKVFACADVCIVLGENSRRFVIEQLQVSAENVKVVINGVPPAMRLRRSERIGAPKQVLFLGNLMERKGVSDLLHALATPCLAKHQWEAHFAGGGDRAHYQAYAQKLGLSSRVHFIGWADKDAAAALLAAADILVLPSYDEGLPLVILEALANGVAIICTPVGEISSFLKDGRDACFVTPGDIPGIAEAIATLFNNDIQRHSLEQAGLQLYEDQFSMKIFFNEIGKIHQQVFGCRADSAEQFGPHYE